MEDLLSISHDTAWAWSIENEIKNIWAFKLFVNPVVNIKLDRSISLLTIAVSHGAFW